MTHVYTVITALLLAMFITRGNLLTRNRSFDVFYDKKYVKLECVVSPLNSRLTFEYNGTTIAFCSPPIKIIYHSKCKSNYGEITQNIYEEKTTLTLEYSAVTDINGIWKCCHATGEKTCITQLVHIPLSPDSECQSAAIQFFLMSFLPAILVAGYGYIYHIHNKDTSGNQCEYMNQGTMWFSFYLMTIGCVFSVTGYLFCFEQIEWYLYLMLPLLNILISFLAVQKIFSHFESSHQKRLKGSTPDIVDEPDETNVSDNRSNQRQNNSGNDRRRYAVIPHEEPSTSGVHMDKKSQQ